MWVTGQAATFRQLPAEVGELGSRQPPLEKGPGIDPGCGVGLKVNLIAAVLLEFGARGVVEEPGALTTYLEPPEDVEALVSGLRKRLEEMTPPSDPPPAVSWSWQAQEDWAEPKSVVWSAAV